MVVNFGQIIRMGGMVAHVIGRKLNVTDLAAVILARFDAIIVLIHLSLVRLAGMCTHTGLSSGRNRIYTDICSAAIILSIWPTLHFANIAITQIQILVTYNMCAHSAHNCSVYR